MTGAIDFFRMEKQRRRSRFLKLNVTLYPQSWNVYDSYGETLAKNGDRDLAIKMYEKSISLNPDNENGKKTLARMQK